MSFFGMTLSTYSLVHKMVIWVLGISAVFLTPGNGQLPEFPDIIANVSLQLGDFYFVDCVQIFWTGHAHHRSTQTIHEVWKRLSNMQSEYSTGMYTYQGYLNRKQMQYSKVSCYTTLKIMSDDDESSKGFARLTRELTIKDAVWVVFSTTVPVDFFRHALVVFDDVMFIAEIKTKTLVLLYEVYKINQNSPLKVLLLGNWTLEKGLILPTQPFYDRRFDLEGTVLRAVSMENWPASYTRNGVWKGFLMEVWKEIESMINCTSVFVRPTANYIGMRAENGSWTGLVGMSMRNETDILVAEIVIDKERSRAVRFLVPILRTRFQIYTQHLGYTWQWLSVLEPFHETVWLAVLTWIVVAAVFLSLTCRLCCSYGLEFQAAQQIFSPVRSIFFIIQTFCSQGNHVTPKSYACRVLFITSYVVSGILIPAYSAFLVSSLAKKTYYESFHSLEDMVKDGTYRLLAQENSAQHAYFVHTKDRFLKTAYKTLVEPVPREQKKLGLREGLSMICHMPNYAVMGIEEIVNVRMYDTSSGCNVVPLKNPVGFIHLTMATSRKSPFWGVINHHLRKLLDNGIVNRLKILEFPPPSPAKTQSNEGVGMQQLVTVYALFGFAALASVVILLVEIQYFLLTTSRKRLKRKKRIDALEQARIIYEYEMRARKKFLS